MSSMDDKKDQKKYDGMTQEEIEEIKEKMRQEALEEGIDPEIADLLALIAVKIGITVKLGPIAGDIYGMMGKKGINVKVLIDKLMEKYDTTPDEIHEIMDKMVEMGYMEIIDINRQEDSSNDNSNDD